MAHGDQATVVRWLPFLCEAKTGIVEALRAAETVASFNLGSKMNIYLTKYCLTKGIITSNSAKTTRTPTMIIAMRDIVNGFCVHKPDWHETKEAALARAEEMRQKRVISLRKQIRKLEQMKFVIEE